MTWLIACERSGHIRNALLALGYDAISCDLFPSRLPGPHIQDDVRNIIHKPWDGLIAHPVCKYLANSGIRWLHTEPGRWNKMELAAEFFNLFQNATHIPFRAIENPRPHPYALDLIGEPDQYVHPWMFGDPYSKETGWWLYNLPKLQIERWRDSYRNGIEQKTWLIPPGPDREEKRSETELGTAKAIARQWGHIPNK